MSISKESVIISSTDPSLPANVAKVDDNKLNTKSTVVNSNGDELEITSEGLAKAVAYITDNSGNPVGVEDTDRLKTTSFIKGENGSIAKVTSGGQLQVSTPPPEAPQGTTPVVVVEYSSVSNTATTYYTITNGKTLILQEFQSSTEADTTAGNVSELWYDPNGNEVGMTALSIQHTSGTVASQSLSQEFYGDGTARIVMKRRRLSGGSKEMFARWQGYEE